VQKNNSGIKHIYLRDMLFMKCKKVSFTGQWKLSGLKLVDHLVPFWAS